MNGRAPPRTEARVWLSLRPPNQPMTSAPSLPPDEPAHDVRVLATARRVSPKHLRLSLSLFAFALSHESHGELLHVLVAGELVEVYGCPRCRLRVIVLEGDADDR